MRARPVGAAASRVAQQQHEEDAAALAALTTEVEEMRESIGVIEHERDFYFDKLREMEIIVSDRLAAAESRTQALAEGHEEEVADIPASTDIELEILRRIQEIMYATDEGFTVPEAEGEEVCSRAD